jgi:hypothetical protein
MNNSLSNLYVLVIKKLYRFFLAAQRSSLVGQSVESSIGLLLELLPLQAPTERSRQNPNKIFKPKNPKELYLCIKLPRTNYY